MSQSLDLSRAPAVLFFYGLAGVGKTHVGRLVSELSGRYFYDADADISEEMKQALAEQRPFTEAMRNEFFPRVVQRIQALQQQYGPLVVTQGAYKLRHREFIRDHIQDIDMLCVSCSEAVMQQRLADRVQGISPASAAALMADFESPSAQDGVICNDSDDVSVVDQLCRRYQPPDAGQ